MFGEVAPTTADRFRVLYYGRFRHDFAPEPLLEGFRRFVDRIGSAADDARLTFVGGLRPHDHACLRALRLEDRMECTGFVPYRHALHHQRQAHALCLVVPPACTMQIPGKLYDYLAARRPILAITDVEIRALLEQTGSGGGHLRRCRPLPTVCASRSIVFGVESVRPRRGGRGGVHCPRARAGVRACSMGHRVSHCECHARAWAGDTA
jgi:hypothetical protein